MKPVFAFRALPLFALVLLTGCEQLGIEDPAKLLAIKEAEGKAIGSACRHALRAIEDCYTLNPKAQKAAVFNGWKEMDEYMRENKLEGVAPVVPRVPVVKPGAEPEEEEVKPKAKSGASDKAADKTAGKEGKPKAAAH
ncbi:hypothetical protein [Roseateles oligotrophus]|uniref:Uncharacterized protein n=1 Tax=Roseateles oligotrophus TaxID=1769250 RepID=A0ABT2YHI4_9BURK|nr:hypothetical protein [Roseateles oligotrophus]MCV2369521.1 hypothetical protein [Roseateles oligotrophus]